MVKRLLGKIDALIVFKCASLAFFSQVLKIRKGIIPSMGLKLIICFTFGISFR